MADTMPLHIRITYQPKTMSNHAFLAHGTAAEVRDFIYFTDSDLLTKSELCCALTNAFDRINTLEMQVTKLRQALEGAGNEC